jgi:hypothetical protein
MILGMSTSAFTLLHVVLSLVGIFTGLAVVFGMFGSHRLKGWTGVFLATTVLTSVTGFFFPTEHLMPSQVVGAISLVVLALYLNVFVAVVQAFVKIPFLKALAPTQSEPPFVIAQALVLVLFVMLAILVLRAFHPKADAPMLGAA